MLVINVPEQDLYDPVSNEFIFIKKQTLHLEHSLLSISKWESKWHKPYLSKEEKTVEEMVDYIRCMTISQNIDPNVYKCLTQENINDIVKYMEDPMTATTVNTHQKPSREIVTSELIYYWMTALNIPFDPCQKWHLNRLLMLIQVCSIKSQPAKKMSRAEIMRRNTQLNAARRAKYGTSG